jgi:anti-anti-sigma factor
MSEAAAFQRSTVEVRALQPNAALVILGGEHDLYSADNLQQALDQSLSCCDHLIVDLSATGFIDSTIVAVLMQTQKTASARGHKFNVVLGTTPTVARILEVTGLTQRLNAVPTIEQALAASP